ncbi:TadG family pilus assembly protein [Brevundimonas vesicularis]|uniref:TadG family pilus assembly protein n=1 Tax=Brevundimonas vesicularis TaxID=41276 RepID=UPI0022AC3C81|nr:TadG family pilus assembly protein [Brevundimonas vesicularis]
MTARLPRLLVRFGADRRGAVAVIAAVAGGLLCLFTAAVIDLGVLVLHTRRVQGAADLAALSAVRNLAQAEGSVAQAALATVEANVAPDVSVTVATALGVYTPDPTKARNARFAPGGATPNAARVEVASRAPMFFTHLLLGRDLVRVTRRATATIGGETPKAMISIGSRLARLDDGVANQLIGGLTGSKVSLSVMDYRRLIDLDVNLLGYTDALATDMGVQAGDYDRLLATQVDAGRALRVLERVAGGQDGGALGKLASASVGTKVRLGDLIGLEARAPDGIREGLDASVSAMDLVMAMLEVGGGDGQVALNLGVPAGLADLKTSLAIGERPNRSPWLTVTADGQPIIRTAQARLYVRARTAQSLSGLARVELPVLIELAASEARLTSLSCDPTREVEVDVRPGVARASIGVVDETRLSDFKAPLSPQRATLLSVAGLVSITGKADVEAADAGFRSLGFDADDIDNQRAKTMASRGFASGAVASLLARLDVVVNVVGLGLGLGDLTKALGQLLEPLGPVLDGALNPVLDLLGLKLGEADVTVHGLSCPDRGRATPRLVG